MHLMAEFQAQKDFKLKLVGHDANYSIQGAGGGSFANASNKNEWKQLM